MNDESLFAPHFDGCRCGECPKYRVEFLGRFYGATAPPLRRVVSFQQTVAAVGGIRVRKELECGHVRTFHAPGMGIDETGMMDACGSCATTGVAP